jgi:hypothetical protein
MCIALYLEVLVPGVQVELEAKEQDVNARPHRRFVGDVQERSAHLGRSDLELFGVGKDLVGSVRILLNIN